MPISGIFHSNDGGASWNQSIGITYGQYNLSISGKNAVAGSYPNVLDSGIWYSGDTGASWTQSGITTGNWNSVALSGKNAIATSEEGFGIWYSGDTGASWTQSGITTGYWNCSRDCISIVSGYYYTPEPEAPCFLSNTKILLHSNEYIPISKIKKGDLVKGVFSKNPVKVLHCGYSIINLDLLAKYNFPRRIPKDFFSEDLPCHDIYLSGGHRILFHNNNNLTYRIPTVCISELNKYEIKSESEIKSITNEEECRYYHIELEDTTEGVIASGLEVESLEKGDWEKFRFIENNFDLT